MKKNLRIVSAAAAALLAVAPVAAAAVVSPATTSVAHADAPKAAGAHVKSYGTTYGDLKNDFMKAVFDPSNYSDIGNNIHLVGKADSATASLQVVRNQENHPLTLNDKTRLYSRNNYTVSAKNAIKVTFNIKTNQNTNDFSGIHDTNYFNNAKFNGTAITASKWNANKGQVTFKIPKSALPSITYYVAPTVNEATDNAYWVRYDGQDLADNATVAANNEQNNWLFTRSDRNHKAYDKLTLGHIENAVKRVVYLKDNEGNRLSFDKNVDYGENGIYATLARQLKNDAVNGVNGLTVFNKDGKPLDATDIDTADKDSYVNTQDVQNLQLRFSAKSGKEVTVTFANSYATDESLPVVMGKYAGHWEQVKTLGGYIKPIVVTENDLGNNTAWNPSDYIRVNPDFNTKAWLSGVQYSGNVDLTKAGLYTVEVKATNAKGKSVDEKVPVIVDALNGHVMTVTKAASVYAINNGVASLTGSSIKTLPVGSQVHVYGSVVTAKLNGVDTQFYQIVSPKGNFYVEAANLKDGVVATTPTTPSATNAVSKTIMHVAAFYDKTGKRLSDPVVHAYNSISVLPTTVKINGKDFYQVVENGKAVEKYVKASNIDATRRTLKHNSYVYKSNGKTYMKSKKHHEVVKSGSSVNTYGGQLKVNGSMMYRIGKNRYIKVANFR